MKLNKLDASKVQIEKIFHDSFNEFFKDAITEALGVITAEINAKVKSLDQSAFKANLNKPFQNMTLFIKE
jgi:hypothetical protein